MSKTSGIIEATLMDGKYEMCMDFNAIMWVEENSEKSFEEMVAGESVAMKDAVILLGGMLQYSAIKEGKTEYSLMEVRKLLAGTPVDKVAGIVQQGLGKQ